MAVSPLGDMVVLGEANALLHLTSDQVRGVDQMTSNPSTASNPNTRQMTSRVNSNHPTPSPIHVDPPLPHDVSILSLNFNADGNVLALAGPSFLGVVKFEEFPQHSSGTSESTANARHTIRGSFYFVGKLYENAFGVDILGINHVNWHPMTSAHLGAILVTKGRLTNGNKGTETTLTTQPLAETLVEHANVVQVGAQMSAQIGAQTTFVLLDLRSIVQPDIVVAPTETVNGQHAVLTSSGLQNMEKLRDPMQRALFIARPVIGDGVG